MSHALAFYAILTAICYLAGCLTGGFVVVWWKRRHQVFQRNVFYSLLGI